MFEEIKEELTNIYKENKYIDQSVFHEKTTNLSGEEKSILIDLFGYSIRKEIPNTISNKTHENSNERTQYAKECIIQKLKELGFNPLETSTNELGKHILCIDENSEIKIIVSTKKDDTFILNERHEKILENNIYYIFARFIDETTIKYYIYKSAEVAKKISEYHIEYNSHLKRDGTPRNNNTMRELMIDEEHLENWNILTK